MYPKQLPHNESANVLFEGAAVPRVLMLYITVCVNLSLL